MVRFDVNRGVATIFLDNPAGRNGWNRIMEAQYFDALDRLDADPSTRAIVVTGAGRTFCPGLDITALQTTSASGGGLDRSGRRPMHYALGVGKPMIAAINGGCAGVGLLQALCCDIRFVSRTARLSTAYSRRGLPAEYGMAWLLTRIMRLDQALDILLSGRTVEAAEAVQLGLVTRLTEPEDLLPTAQAYAMDVAANCSPRSLKAIRYQVYGPWSRLPLPNRWCRTLHRSSIHGNFADRIAQLCVRQPPLERLGPSHVERFPDGLNRSLRRSRMLACDGLGDRPRSGPQVRARHDLTHQTDLQGPLRAHALVQAHEGPPQRFPQGYPPPEPDRLQRGRHAVRDMGIEELCVLRADHDVGLIDPVEGAARRHTVNRTHHRLPHPVLLGTQ